MLTIKVDDKLAQKRLAALEAAASNMAPVFETVGAALLRRVQLCFKLGIDPWGKPWLAIKWRAPRTLKGSKASAPRLSAAGKKQFEANQAGTPGQPLRNTGALQRSISAKADASGVTIGTNLKYAKVHQFGATIRPKNGSRLVFPGPGGAMIFAKKVVVPARPYLPLRRDATIADLPPAWSAGVVDSLRAYFRKEVA